MHIAVLCYFVLQTFAYAENEHWRSYLEQKAHYLGHFGEMLRRKNEQYYSKREVMLFSHDFCISNVKFFKVQCYFCCSLFLLLTFYLRLSNLYFCLLTWASAPNQKTYLSTDRLIYVRNIL